MRARGTFLGNAAALASGNLAAGLLGLLFVATFARSRGASDLGMFQFASSVASLAGLLVALGLDVLLVREVARDRSRAASLASASLAVKSTLSLAALASVAALAHLRYGGIQGRLLLIVAAAALLETMAGTLTAVFRGFERMEYEAAVVTAGSALSALAATGALAAGWDLVTCVTCWSSGAALKLAAAFALARRRFLTPPAMPAAARAGGSRPAIELLRPSLACGSLAIIGAVYSNADVVMLREMASAEEVGWYAAATKLITVALYAPSLVAAGLFPVLSRQAADPHARARLRDTYARGYEAFLLAGLAAGVGCALVARPLVRLVYGEGFERSAVALILLAPYLGWFFVNLLNGTALIAMGRQAFLAAGTGAATVFNVAANAVAIPIWGLEGACGATVVASGAGAVLYTVVCHRELGLRFPWARAARAATCAAAMAAGVAVLARLGAHVLILIACGALLYAVCLSAAGLAPAWGLFRIRPPAASAEEA